jgi:alkylhydroperoxidase family enzyme
MCVSDVAWDRVKDHSTPVEIIDLTPLVNTINAWNGFVILFRKLPV